MNETEQQGTRVSTSHSHTGIDKQNLPIKGMRGRTCYVLAPSVKTNISVWQTQFEVIQHESLIYFPNLKDFQLLLSPAPNIPVTSTGHWSLVRCWGSAFETCPADGAVTSNLGSCAKGGSRCNSGFKWSRENDGSAMFFFFDGQQKT